MKKHTNNMAVNFQSDIFIFGCAVSNWNKFDDIDDAAFLGSLILSYLDVLSKSKYHVLNLETKP